MPSSCALARGRLLLCVAAVAQARQVDRWRVFLYLACLRSLGSMVERVGTAGTVYNQELVFAVQVYLNVEGKGFSKLYGIVAARCASSSLICQTRG